MPAAASAHAHHKAASVTAVTQPAPRTASRSAAATTRLRPEVSGATITYDQMREAFDIAMEKAAK